MSLGNEEFDYLDDEKKELPEQEKPNIVVKGSEHENQFNSEQSFIENYGGKLIFSSLSS